MNTVSFSTEEGLPPMDPSSFPAYEVGERVTAEGWRSLAHLYEPFPAGQSLRL